MSRVAERSYRASAVFARCTVVVAALLACAATGAVAATPREQVEARRMTNPHVTVDVISGEQLTGTIERTMENEFYLVDKSGIDRILVPYTAVRALIDPKTGERTTLDLPPPPAPRPAAAPPPMTAERSTMLWIVGGAVGAGLLLWVVASRLKRS